MAHCQPCSAAACGTARALSGRSASSTAPTVAGTARLLLPARPATLSHRRGRAAALRVSALAGLQDVLAQLPDLASVDLASLEVTPSGVGALLRSAVASAAVPAVVQQIAGDVASLLELSPTLPGVGRLALLWYTFLGKPAPIVGVLDYWVTGPLATLTAKK